jgi:cytoskeletal protein RodZ
MEEDRFGLLGAPVFARGHLRSYAALVGAPESEVIAAFDVGDLPEPTLLPAGGLAAAAPRPRRLWAVAIAVVAAGAAAGVAWWMTRH